MAKQFGDGRDFTIERRPVTAPAADEVRVRVRAAAVNHVDTIVAAGRYQAKPDLPFTPGGEFAGEVAAVGRAVRGIFAGDHVCGSGLSGAFAESVTVRASALSPLPPNMHFIEGATFRVAHGTAMAGLVQGAGLKSGETVLVLGAGGAVGFAAVGIAKALGARVIASASTEQKRALATAAGADAVLAGDADGWRDRLRALVGDAPLDVVVDPVGGTATESAFRSLGWGGRHLVIGFAGGLIPALPTNLALVKGLRLVGVNFGRFTQCEPVAMASNTVALRQMWEVGKIGAPPIRTYPFEQFADAMQAAAERGTIGRIVLNVS
ncbi:NADPH:quinone oxidoreductase family protein [Sphingomonas sp. BAUL-RG-20F-R05-02]|uniref:NADPH:quinone oxidoreductase family protein n=1 Tax=Sphingomonas sp. BAUL-RG-20F-R05-02 TaxID=2914830 RepID=UPI001F56CDF0|nr:NADPH:quinone oxidoreductase family protein [Sphingomonas sp. BAUL-RG-20F-R05-02]